MCSLLIFASNSCLLRWAHCWAPVWRCSTWTVCRMSLPSYASTSGWAMLSMKVSGGGSNYKTPSKSVSTIHQKQSWPWVELQRITMSACWESLQRRASKIFGRTRSVKIQDIWNLFHSLNTRFSIYKSFFSAATEDPPRIQKSLYSFWTNCCSRSTFSRWAVPFVHWLLHPNLIPFSYQTSVSRSC